MRRVMRRDIRRDHRRDCRDVRRDIRRDHREDTRKRAAGGDGLSDCHLGEYLGEYRQAAMGFQYILLGRITAVYCRVCLAYILAIAPAIAVAGTLAMRGVTSRVAISSLRMRVLLLSCFLGATLIAGSILPAAFLFQSAPLPSPLKQVCIQAISWRGGHLV